MSDHNRLDALLTSAVSGGGAIRLDAYGEFRKRLLRHVAIEEKIVFPMVSASHGGTAPLVERLHADHAAIVSLMVPPPNPSIVQTLQFIFAVHNPLEENESGLYELFEKAAEGRTGDVLARIEATRDVLVLPYNDKPESLERTRQAVLRAGYELK